MSETPRRRWFSIRLRTLFVFITLLCVLLGYVVRERRESARQLAALKRAEADFGVSMIYAGRFDDRSLSWRQPQPAWREWCNRLLGYYASELNWDEDYASSPGFPDLRDFPDLEILDCHGKYPTDLEQLRGTSRLESLQLSGNAAITDLSPLTGHRQLSQISIEGAHIRDLRPLASLTHLFSLSLRDNLAPIDDLGPLAHLRELEILDLANVSADLHPLAGLPRLRWLAISSPKLRDLGPLAPLKTLWHFSCNGSPVEDLRPLSELANLESLELQGTHVEDIAPLSSLKELTSLNLNFTRVTDVSALAALPKLKSLYIAGCPMTSLATLKGLRHLESLRIAFDQFSSEQFDELRAALPNVRFQMDSGSDPEPKATSDAGPSEE